MSIVDPVKRWVLGIGLKKGVTSLVKLIISYAAAHAISINVNVPGIGIFDTSSELALTAFINSALAVLRNWLKIKYPKLSWL